MTGHCTASRPDLRRNCRLRRRFNHGGCGFCGVGRLRRLRHRQSWERYAGQGFAKKNTTTGVNVTSTRPGCNTGSRGARKFYFWNRPQPADCQRLGRNRPPTGGGGMRVWQGACRTQRRTFETASREPARSPADCCFSQSGLLNGRIQVRELPRETSSIWGRLGARPNPGAARCI